ncbi:MAG: SDR family NAD(P)-dependent oxidoreductase, partial [Chloroflexi bacterium]|nr:SDR family NAD(P)-dependent oxidoreductase [Chloroflexota bacterium]
MAQFAGKTALVTGGGRGIGRAICLELAAGGATVLVNYHRSAAAAAEVVAEIAGQGGVAHSLQADASHEAQVAELFKQARALTSGLDILVNNAGMTRDNVIMLMK